MTKEKERKVSLSKQGHALADTREQIRLLSDFKNVGIKQFSRQMREIDLFPLKPTGVEIFQINVGKMCNQVCKHCHVDAGPDRKEIMTRETMQECLDVIEANNFSTVDLTGGAPEMNPDFRWFVEEIRKRGPKVLVRCNLTIIVSNPKYHDLPEFFKQHEVEVVSSLPYFAAKRTDAQRGEGVFEQSIRALKMLNAVGYGLPDSDLRLNLVYNPSGAFLPGDQDQLHAQFEEKLREGFDIRFHDLFAITNLPVSRFLQYLVTSEQYEEYMNELVQAFNPMAAAGVMCRNTISISWDGFLYDCDFNQMLELKLSAPAPQHIRDWNTEAVTSRDIVLNQHCYGCTAGAGSSCGGTVV